MIQGTITVGQMIKTQVNKAYRDLDCSIYLYKKLNNLCGLSRHRHFRCSHYEKFKPDKYANFHYRRKTERGDYP